MQSKLKTTKKVPRGLLRKLLFGYNAESSKVDVLPEEDERPLENDAPQPPLEDEEPVETPEDA
ncbi:MAG TPA: hypothetical protein GXX40_07140 [Firmicutes bacterium]|nr:hypothetical protein [Bacillota bacterium]